jgi:hypothetical protein
MWLSTQQVFASCILLLVVVIAAAALIFLSIFASNIKKQAAFGDGLTQELLSASLGNRKADLLIKMTPSVVTTESLQSGQKPIVEFRLFNSNTNESYFYAGFSHVTYYIILEKDGKRLLTDIFHDHNGDLKIQMNPTNTTKTAITGAEQDPLLGIWTERQTDPIIASGPIFLTGGLYHFIVRIETVDSDYTLLPDNQKPIYDSWLSIGNTEQKQIDVEGKQIPIKVISYYDKLKDFEFDNKNMQVKFDMPFNWNLSRLNKTSIFVHEELYVPKPNAFTVKGSYAGTVNGIDISKNVMLDDSNPDKDIIHVMLSKSAIVHLADQMNKSGQASTGLMKFTLQPGTGSMKGTMASMSSGSSMGSMS